MRSFPIVIAMAIALCNALAARFAASRAVIKFFAGALQEQPMSPMAVGRTAAATEVCKFAAPEITATAWAAGEATGIDPAGAGRC